MPEIILGPITQENQKDCIQLQVREDQKGYLPDVQSSLELAKRYKDSYPLAIYSEKQLVGFGLYGIDEETNCWKIYRLLIDQAFQGQGFGKQALDSMVKIMRDRHSAETILVCYQEDNLVARSIYDRYGFIEYQQEGTKIFSRLNPV